MSFSTMSNGLAGKDGPARWGIGYSVGRNNIVVTDAKSSTGVRTGAGPHAAGGLPEAAVQS